MNRRRPGLHLAIALTLATAVASAQPSPARIAWIGPSDAAGQAKYIASFKDGMSDNGLVEGRNYVLDAQYADGHYDRFPAMIDAALKRDPALIMAITIASVRAAQLATNSVPIVFMSTNDPVGSGLVASLARPGGNTTGISNQAEDVIVKYVELVHATLPRAKRVAVLLNPDNPSNQRMFELVRAAADASGMTAVAYEAASPEAIDSALDAIARQRPDALIQNSDAMLIQHRDRIAAFALKQRIPAIGTSPEAADSGYLLAYGADRLEIYRRAANYARKILAGARPADLPVEQPTRFKLIINLKTAKALGLTIPQSLLLRADEVIQ